MFYAAVIGVPLAISIFVLLRILFALGIMKRPTSLDELGLKAKGK